MYKVNNNYYVSMLLMLIISLLSASDVFAGGVNRKYQDVFYPDGMPLKPGMYGEGQTVYTLHDELPIPGTDSIVVIGSEEVVAEPGYSDTVYDVFISILQSANGEESIKFQKDVTGYLPLSIEQVPGFFSSMSGSLDYFSISETANAVHLYMWNKLSGSGGINSSSDIFFLINNDALVPILELTRSGYGSRAGVGYSSFSYTFIYVADTDSDGTTDIITQGYSYINDRTDDVFESELSSELDVYTYDSVEEKYNLSGQIATLPPDAILLNPDLAPDVDAITQEGCCP